MTFWTLSQPTALWLAWSLSWGAGTEPVESRAHRPIAMSPAVANGIPIVGADADQADDWQELFDGATLTGWQGRAANWRVEDGAITGQSLADAPLENNTFLIWQGEPLVNFELKLQFRMEGNNSGVQFRSERVDETTEDKFYVKGYQADIDFNKRFTGILYEERGRGILAERGQRVEISPEGNKSPAGSTGDLADFGEKVDEKEWCDYTLLAVGPEIKLTINGITTVEVTDRSPEAATQGILALQLHQGAPMKVQFRNIRLRRIK